MVVGIGDDGAILDVPNDQLLCVATDVLTADVHFPSDAAPNLIAQKSLAVNLSDMAAMGATPLCFTLGLTIPLVENDWMQEFSAGLFSLAKRYDCPLVGGDTTKGPMAVAITIHGFIDKSQHILREGAAVGDSIYVTGTLGDGALALPALGMRSHLGERLAISSSLSEQQIDFFTQAYYQPEPRVEFAQACKTIVSSGIDVSDGLVGDLGHILSASEVGAELFIDRLPYSEVTNEVASLDARRMAALFGGDDYELCMTVPSAAREEFERLSDQYELEVTCIGEITTGNGISFLNESREKIEIHLDSYEHFKPSN